MDIAPRRLILTAAVVVLLAAASVGLAFTLPLESTDRSIPFDTTAGTDATAPYTETAAVNIDGGIFFDYSYVAAAEGAEHLVLETDGGNYYIERYSAGNSSVTHTRISVVDEEEADRRADNSDGEVVDRYQEDSRHVVLLKGEEITSPGESADSWRYLVWSTLYQADYEPASTADEFDVYAASDAWHLYDGPGRDVRISHTDGEVVIDGDQQVHRTDVSYRVTPGMSYAHYYRNLNDSETLSVAYDFDAVDAEVDAPDWIDE
ncbi:hypothetical protein [Natronobeatus ordinarius]|uniref:hypothetical protein n=1 Tax=Natronobeatus ordinarius TaxID=2963433 RepID=UPI0020CD0B99|nr:hypothetical protein [Natronobeatus ordinarius]